MARVDGREPRTCSYCGQTSEDLYYPLHHPERCSRKIDDERKELLLQLDEQAQKYNKILDGKTEFIDKLHIENSQLRERANVSGRLIGEMRPVVEAAIEYYEADDSKLVEIAWRKFNVAISEYRQDKTEKRNVTRTNLEQYLGVSIQMLMARADGRDETSYLDKLDEIGDRLTQEEKAFCDEMGKDWAKK